MILLSIVGMCGGTEYFQRLNYGVVFEKIDKIVIGTDSWYHTFEIDLPQETSTPYLSPCTDNSTTCSLLSHLITQLNAVRSEIFSRLNETAVTIQNLIPETQIHTSRSRRALLPFIGKLSRSIFGTASIEDVELLAKHMNKISKMTIGLSRALTQHEDHLSSYMNAANARMDNLMKGVKDNMLAMQYIKTKVFTGLHDLEYSFEHILGKLIDQIKTTTSLTHEIEEFKLGVTYLVNGKLSPLLIPYETMQSTINDISTLVHAKFSGFHLSVTDAKFSYNTKFVYARNKTKLYVTVKFPISNFQKPLTRYKIISVPVPVNSTSEHATQILDLSKYLIITSDHQYYATIDNLDSFQCMGDNPKICKANIALSPVTTQSCTLALFANDKNIVKSLCDFRYIQSVIKPKIMELNPNSLLLYRTPLLSMQCLNEHKMVKGCDFCVINLPCRCSISTNEIYFAPRLSMCNNHKDNITTLHPVNLALLQHFFSDNERIENIMADTTFHSAINLTIPQFEFYQHDISNVLVADHKAHLNLSKMADATKQDAKIFQSLAEPLLDNQIQLQTNWPDMDSILIFCTMGMTALLSVITFWSVCKLRKLSASILLLQNAQMARSFPTELPSFEYKTKHLVTSDTNSLINFDVTFDHINLILLSIITILLLFQLWKKSTVKSKSKICLEITSGKECVLIDVHCLPRCMSDYHIETPDVIENLTVSYDYWILPKLFVSWPGFHIKNNSNEQIIQIQSEFNINPLTAIKLRHILRKPFFVYLYKKHYGNLEILRD